MYPQQTCHEIRRAGISACVILTVLLTGAVCAGEGPLSLKSPDGTIEVSIGAAGAPAYAVSVDGRVIVQASRLGLRLADGVVLGQDAELLNAERRSVNSTWTNPLGKRRTVRDRYNELRLVFREPAESTRNFEIVFRAFDDGVGFRYVLPAQSAMESFVLEQDLTEFVFADDYTCYAGQHAEDRGFRGPQEWEFERRTLSDIKAESIIGLPLLVQTSAAWIALTEADLLDWAGMWLAAGQASSERDGVALAVKLAPRLDGKGLVVAETPHQSSWRVLVIGREPGRLVESDLVSNLSTPCRLEDPSWIRPGMMAWDHWWSGDVQMDTATIKEYIQLAADMGWEYQLIDWQWYGPYNRRDADIMTVNPAVDMDEVRRFAADRDVRLWLWLYFTDVDRNDAYKKAFALYEQWGIAGIKIDFMDRDDQEMVNWYEKIARAAAGHHLMVNFHGAFKTSGFNRTFPNQVTREGILGNEYNRWSARVTPEHKLILPFTRYVAGAADYTPGGFLNRQSAAFQIDPNATQVQGTRCAELALFVLYDSPVCCVCDHPSHYYKQDGADFLQIVPTVWDDTRVLEADIGKYLVMLRRSGEQWYLGALTDNTPRRFAVKLDFLAKGQWKIRMWKDAADSNVNGEHLEIEERSVTTADTVTLSLAPAGGCVIRFQKE